MEAAGGDAAGWSTTSTATGFAYHGFPLLARLIGGTGSCARTASSRSPASFRPAEWRAILADAGIDPTAPRGSSGASPSGCASNGCADRRRRAGGVGGGDRAGAGRRDAGADRAQRPASATWSAAAFSAGTRSPRCSRLGLDPAALGARPIHRLRLVAGTQGRRGGAAQGRRRPVAPAARRDPAAHGRGGRRGGAARPGGAGAGGTPAPARRRRGDGGATRCSSPPASTSCAAPRGRSASGRVSVGPAHRAGAVARAGPGAGRDDRAPPLRRRLCRACCCRRTARSISASRVARARLADGPEALVARADRKRRRCSPSGSAATAARLGGDRRRALWLAGARDRARPATGSATRRR